MSDTAELRSQVNREEAQLAQTEQEQMTVDEKIELLKDAQKKLAEEKKAVETLRKAVSKQAYADTEWKGAKRNLYNSYISADFGDKYDTYYSKVDDLHDSIIREIANLQNESRRLGGIIGSLVSSINSLWATIRAALN